MSSEGIFQGIKAICFDFDGVFTDNLIWIGESGEEFVVCSKADSLGLDLFRDFLRENKLDLRMMIVSKETSKLVPLRAKKLGLECHHAVDNKALHLQNVCGLSRKEFIYFGNDQNDSEAMKNAFYSLAPKDADKTILEFASFVSEYCGGRGFIRDGLQHLITLYGQTAAISDNL